MDKACVYLAVPLQQMVNCQWLLVETARPVTCCTERTDVV